MSQELKPCENCIKCGSKLFSVEQGCFCTPCLRKMGKLAQEMCDKCGQPAPTWFTDNDLWNALDRSGILCMSCFIALTEQRPGFNTTGWKLIPEERTRSDAHLLRSHEIYEAALKNIAAVSGVGCNPETFVAIARAALTEAAAQKENGNGW